MNNNNMSINLQLILKLYKVGIWDCSRAKSFSASTFFLEFAEASPSWQSNINLLRPDQNEAIKHAVLREWRNAPATPRRHDCGWMWLPVMMQRPPISEKRMKTLSLSSLILVSGALLLAHVQRWDFKWEHCGIQWDGSFAPSVCVRLIQFNGQLYC